MSNSSQPIPIVRAYFGTSDLPIVAEAFRPRKGWRRQNYRKRITGAWANKLRREEVTHVALRLGHRRADFTIAELCRSSRASRGAGSR
jgi:hypothetical protein